MFSAAPDFPEVFVLIVERQQAIARVVTLAAFGTGNEAADVHSPPVVILGHGKAHAATAGDEEHAKFFLVFCFILFHLCARFASSSLDRHSPG